MNTPVEKALPVDMQIKALKVQGIGAMVMIMHCQRNPRRELLAESRRQGRDERFVDIAITRACFTGRARKPGCSRSVRSGAAGRTMLRAIDRMTLRGYAGLRPSLQMAMRG